MSTFQQTTPFDTKTGFIVGLVAIVSIGMGGLLLISPKLAAGLFIAVIAAALIWRSVNVATYLVFFCVYSNLAAVAVRFHGVPAIAAHAVVGLLIIPLLYFIVLRRQPIILGRSFIWIALLTLSQFLGALFAKQPQLAWVEFNSFLLEGLLLYLLVVNVIRDKSTLRNVTWSLLVAGLISGGIPLFQQLSGTFENNYGGLAQTGDEPGFTTDDDEVEQMRLSGPIGEKNRYAQIMLMLVPLALFRIRDERGLLRLLATIALLCAVSGVFLAFSRSTILCAGFIIVLAAILRHVNRFKVAVVGALLFAGLMATPQYRTRLSSLLDLKSLLMSGKHSEADGALKGRATEMGAALLVFRDHPLIGVGPGQFKYYSREYGERIGIRALDPERQAHCLPLDVAAENGLLGLTGLLGLFVTLGVGLYRQTEEDVGELSGLKMAVFYMLLVYGITGLFLHFAYIRYFWLMVGIAEASLRIKSLNPSMIKMPISDSPKFEHEGI
ncbi:O-antigen ligase family protein [Rubinisphaera italica]|uniref:O-Antigen ligase n=1 Tax=Rubinisphaera italica TaxID=2527969 RepID=A0A5C5XFX9_9PLAN|nr:O-antigen ligase family protein [Rubinisphaera italica]TWT61559.1 O-Antigen ligase [Rubinisphaera italica]